MKTKIAIIIFMMSLPFVGCNKKNVSDAATSDIGTPIASQLPMADSKPRNYIPSAIVYKTNGNYDDKVSIGLNNSGTSITSYPAPTDITPTSAPVKLSDGYLLDRRGIGPSSGFIDMTYDQYAALKSTPSPEQLKSMIIPGAKVVFLAVLPITAGEAARNPEAAQKFVTDGFKDCRILIGE